MAGTHAQSVYSFLRLQAYRPDCQPRALSGARLIGRERGEGPLFGSKCKSSEWSAGRCMSAAPVAGGEGAASVGVHSQTPQPRSLPSRHFPAVCLAAHSFLFSRTTALTALTATQAPPVSSSLRTRSHLALLCAKWSEPAYPLNSNTTMPEVTLFSTSGHGLVHPQKRGGCCNCVRRSPVAPPRSCTPSLIYCNGSWTRLMSSSLTQLFGDDQNMAVQWAGLGALWMQTPCMRGSTSGALQRRDKLDRRSPGLGAAEPRRVRQSLY